MPPRPTAKKVSKDVIKSDYVRSLIAEQAFFEAAVGENYYHLFSLPATTYGSLMNQFRLIWHKLTQDKEDKYADAIEAAKALASNMSELSDPEARDDAQKILQLLSEATNIHPLEFLAHEDFTENVSKLMDVVLADCDPADREALTTEQMARIFEIVFTLNFLPFIRFAASANRMFRGDGDSD